MESLSRFLFFWRLITHCRLCLSSIFFSCSNNIINRIERIDHVNRDIKDCRKENLRVITVKQNATNRTGRNRNNTSGYRNVCWDKKNDRWIVQLSVDGKNKCFGRFPKEQLKEAGKFAEQMRKEVYGEEFAGGN